MIAEDCKERCAIPITEGNTEMPSGRRTPKKITQGWKQRSHWKGRNVMQVQQKRMQDFNPLELADYETVNRIYDEAAFNWLVHDSIRHHNHIIGHVKIDIGTQLISLEYNFHIL